MSFLEKISKNYIGILVKKEPQLKPDELFTNFGRLIFSLTTRCNFRCQYCLRELNEVRDLPLPLIQRILESAKRFNFRHASLTGGEPLLYPKFEELVKLIISQQYQFSIVTNGSLWAQYHTLLSDVKSSITRVKFSIDSPSRETQDALRQEGSFDQLVKNFRLCRQSKIPFWIQAVINPINQDQLYDLAIFAKSQKAACLSIGMALPCPRATKNQMILSQQKREEIIRETKILSKILHLPVSIGYVLHAYNNIQLCPSLSLQEIAIDTRGNICACCGFVDDEAQKEYPGAYVTSLEDKTFEEGLKIYSRYIHETNLRRIDDYIKHQNPNEDPDFNSCLYCLSRFKTHFSLTT